MEASEIIALAAVLVTGIGAAVTVGVNAWLANRRLGYEESMQSERFAHDGEILQTSHHHDTVTRKDQFLYEREETVRTIAAKAYGATDSALRFVTRKMVLDGGSKETLRIAQYRDDEKRARELVSIAMEDLGVVATLGWNSDVRDSAKVMRDRVADLADAGWDYVEEFQQFREETEAESMLSRFEAQITISRQALENYRLAVAGENVS